MKLLRWVVAKIVCFWDGHAPLMGHWDGKEPVASDNYLGVSCRRCGKYWGPDEAKNVDEHRY
jgi:hypothetical protein